MVSSVDFPSCISSIFIDTHIYNCNLQMKTCLVRASKTGFENMYMAQVCSIHDIHVTDEKKRVVHLVCVCRVCFKRISKGLASCAAHVVMPQDKHTGKRHWRL